VVPDGVPQRVDHAEPVGSEGSGGGGDFSIGINVTKNDKSQRSPPKPVKTTTPPTQHHVKISNMDASNVIANVKNELIVKKTKQAVDEANSLCDRGERSYDTMIEILKRDVMGDYLEKVLEQRTECKQDSVRTKLKAGRMHGNVALRHAQNHSSNNFEDTTSGLPLIVRRDLLNAAENIGNVAEIMSTCGEELIHEGLGYHNKSDGNVPTSLWNAAAASAKAATRAFEICAATIGGTKSGHDEQSRAALVAAETSAKIVQSQLPELPEPIENGSANECEAKICTIDRWADDKDKSTRQIKQNACLHGCVGSLIDMENRKLHQVIHFRTDSTCERYCSGVVTQPSVRRTISDGQEGMWENACLKGCHDGYSRRPHPCLVSDMGDVKISCH